jgi:adenylylsulfate kinase-like enzyme
MVVWIIGLSGSGKTTLSEEVASLLRQLNRTIAVVDGDVIREVFGNDADHSLEGRRRNANRICALCRFLESQGVVVICAILSIFRESRLWNRENLENYYEVFVDAPIEQLILRDSKGLYGKYLRGEINAVAGMDLIFPVPDDADLIIKNDGDIYAFLQNAQQIVDHVRGIL